MATTPSVGSGMSTQPLTRPLTPEIARTTGTVKVSQTQADTPKQRIPLEKSNAPSDQAASSTANSPKKDGSTWNLRSVASILLQAFGRELKPGGFADALLTTWSQAKPKANEKPRVGDEDKKPQDKVT